jgi:hypothetical protein
MKNSEDFHCYRGYRAKNCFFFGNRTSCFYNNYNKLKNQPKKFILPDFEKIVQNVKFGEGNVKFGQIRVKFDASIVKFDVIEGQIRHKRRQI